MACKSKVAGRRAKRTEIWGSGTLQTYRVMGYIDLVGFKVILESFGALVLKWPLARKRLVAEKNGVNLKLGDTTNTYVGYL